MKRRSLTLAACALAAAMALLLAGCGASLDRDVDVQGMTISVPSGWAEDPDDDNGEDRGSVWYTDIDEDKEEGAFDAIRISYQRVDVTDQSTAADALEQRRAELEGDYGTINWEVDDSSEQVIDGAQVSMYEYGFDKEIDHVTNTYDYKIAYVYTPAMHYEIQVYGSAASIDDVVGSIEL